MKTRLPLSLALLCVFALTVATSARADQVPTAPTPSLSDLLVPNSYLQTSDGAIRFDQFFFSAVPPATGFTPSADDIFVTMVESAGEVRLLFQFVGTGEVGSGEAFDLAVEYRASVLDPTIFAFSGHQLDLNASSGPGGSVVLRESLDDNFSTTYANLEVSERPPLPPDDVETVFFSDPLDEVFARKNVSVNGRGLGSGGFAGIADFSQTFFVQAIPEPASIMLLILGTVGVCFLGRRLRSEK